MIEHELPWVPPLEAAERLRHLPGFAFLDSGGEDLATGRYAFIGHSPYGEFVIQDGRAFWCGAPLEGAPLMRLREILGRWRLDPDPDGPPLRGGCIGHFSYDLGQSLEQLARPERGEPGCTDLRLAFYDLICTFDRLERRFRIFSSGFPHQEGTSRAARAKARLAETLAFLEGTPLVENQSGRAVPCAPVSGWRSNFTPRGFREAVDRVRAHILSGDIYQANLTQRFEAALPEGFDTWAFYRTLRKMNPAPFGAYLQDGKTVFASSSPERFLSLRAGEVEGRPIKGTSPRDADPAKDRALAIALEASEKDRAENIMIVDLLRNDLSRVCAPGSVEVPVLCGLESYASVHHLTSVVRGRMQPGRGAIDLIESCFPGGSITGAPKIRAMDVITEQEKIARGVYCGSIGYVGFDGAMDLNIAIRTAILGAGRAVVQAGGGITLLSDPVAEYAESLCKADRLFAAFAASPESGAPCF
ncbi:aminobenzoate synthetase [Rhodovulum sp. NI22]|nr:aminobenzoate synthetase [Rhodovulum sp. NI22]